MCLVRNLEKWIFYKLTDMVTFQTNISSTVKKMQISISFESSNRKQCLCYFLFLKWWKPRFLISERVFHWFLPDYKEFAHETSHTQPSKYDSNSGTKISMCLKKIGGMRLWIGTSTFKLITNITCDEKKHLNFNNVQILVWMSIIEVYESHRESGFSIPEGWQYIREIRCWHGQAAPTD